MLALFIPETTLVWILLVYHRKHIHKWRITSLPTLFELQCHHFGPITSMFLQDPASVICAILSFCLRCVHFVFLLSVSMWNRFSLSGFFLSALAKKMMLPIVYSMDSLFLSPEYGQYIHDSHSQDRRIFLA